jgi:hypothetical protein
MVKDKDLKDVDPILNVEGLGKEPIDYVKIADKVGKNVIGGLMLYITADTLRKVIIYTVSAKV